MKNKKFRIIAPFVEINQIKPLKEAGVDELYCGYIDKESEKLWPASFCTINRRGKGHSFEDYESFKRAISTADKLKLPVYLAMNGFYTQEQYPWVIKTIRKLSKLPGLKGLIVADLGLLLYLKKIGYQKEIHVSTLTANLNHYAVDFFVSLGADRVILDRQLTTEEIKEVISKRKTNSGIEIFVFDDVCFFIDGYCGFAHYSDSRQKRIKLSKDISFARSYSMVESPRHGCEDIQGLLQSGKLKVNNILYKGNQTSPFVYQRNKYSFHCNLCSLFDLKNFKPITLKIVSRGTDVSRVVKLVSEVVSVLGSKNINRRRFHQVVKKLYYGFYKIKCDGSGCSYLELLKR